MLIIYKNPVYIHQGLQGQLNDLNAENWQKTQIFKTAKF